LLRRGVRRRWIVLTLVLGIAASALFRAALCLGVGTHVILHVCATSLATRADAFLAGSLLGLLAVWGHLPQRRGPRLALQVAAWSSAAALLGLMLGTHIEDSGPAFYAGGLTFVDLGVALILAALLCSPPRPAARVLGGRLLTWVGSVSYGLYLYHYPIFLLPMNRVAALVDGPQAKLFLVWGVKVFLTFAAAAASYAWVERPFLRRKARLARA
jgi:peptidoglycan/LPS O-acetylase OafA/YrhL